MSSPLNRSSALELIDAIQPLITAAETGILDTYPALLVSANVNYAAYLDTDEGQDPHVIQIARQILDDARTGWSLIESIPHSGSRFIGGGFGLSVLRAPALRSSPPPSHFSPRIRGATPAQQSLPLSESSHSGIIATRLQFGIYHAASEARSAYQPRKQGGP